MGQDLELFAVTSPSPALPCINSRGRGGDGLPERREHTTNTLADAFGESGHAGELSSRTGGRFDAGSTSGIFKKQNSFYGLLFH